MTLTDKARELAEAFSKRHNLDAYLVPALAESVLAALQRERDEAANANCEVCEGFYTCTECGGTKEKPYRPNHCRFRAAILSQPKGETRKEGGGMNEWQRCPVCDGHGLVAYPPGVAYGMQFSTSSAGPWPCQRCNGAGTILRPAPDKRSKEGKA